jgi:hypothetical protein
MLYYQNKAISSVFYNGKRIKEVFLGDKQVFPSSQWGYLMEPSEYNRLGFYMKDYRLMATDGTVVAEGVSKAIPSPSSIPRHIAYIKNGTLYIMTAGIEDPSFSIEEDSSGWSSFIHFRGYPQGSASLVGIKDGCAFMRTKYYSEYCSTESVVKVSADIPSVTELDDVCGTAMTRDGQCLICFSDGEGWKRYCDGAKDIFGQIYLNEDNELRAIKTDRLALKINDPSSAILRPSRSLIDGNICTMMFGGFFIDPDTVGLDDLYGNLGIKDGVLYNLYNTADIKPFTDAPDNFVELNLHNNARTSDGRIFHFAGGDSTLVELLPEVTA